MEKKNSFLTRLNIFYSFELSISCLVSFYAGIELSYVLKSNTLISALWSQISAIIVTRPNMKESLEFGFYRVLGNALGASLFFLFHLLLESRRLSFILTIFFAVGISNAIGQKKLVPTAVMASAIILAICEIEPTSPVLRVSYCRVIESLLGSLVAIIVKYITTFFSQLVTSKMKR